MTTYEIDADRLTIIKINEFGERIDLNAEGTPCMTAACLREFVREVCEQGGYDEATRDALLAEVDQTVE